MAVFVTGATGYIGSVICEKLRARGHDVCGLARSDEAERKLEGAGVAPVRGDLADLHVVRTAAASSEGVIHAAQASANDQAIAETILGALEGSGKPFIYTSGVWVMGETRGRLAGEMFPCHPPAPLAWRLAVEKLVAGASDRKVCGIVIRPASVYGRRGGLIGGVLSGKIPVIGNGAYHWSFVHVDDLADLYVLAAEKAASGSLYIAADGPAFQVSQLAAEAGISNFVPLDEARQTLGAMADFLTLDQKVGSTRAARELRWRPVKPTVLELIRRGYFQE
jgi:nucleoside-diphosphate-sugar epimerase